MRKKIEDMIPTLEQVREYVISLHTYYTPETFFNYYQAIGWKFNRRRIYDWKAVARFWAANCNAQKTHKVEQAVRLQQMIAEERERNQQERERRLARQKAQSVSYEEYQRMKAAGEISVLQGSLPSEESGGRAPSAHESNV